MKTKFWPDDSIEFNTVAVLGDFDGVHSAHRMLIEKAVSRAKENNLKSLVYTFEKSIKKDFNLISNENKKKIFEEMGVDILVFQKVSEDFFNTSPEDFVRKTVVEKLKASYVIVGENYTFGKKGAGKSEDLKRLLEENSVECEIVKLVEMDEKVLSSTQIREFLREGNVKDANKFLGRRYSISGVVEYGNRIGRTIGFPTVNIRPEGNELLPKFGVYAVYANIDGEMKKGVANVGIKPTVGGKIPLVETNVFGMEGEFYGERIEVEFVDFIRPEQKFPDIETLKEQIEKDKLKAKIILE